MADHDLNSEQGANMDTCEHPNTQKIPSFPKADLDELPVVDISGHVTLDTVLTVCMTPNSFDHEPRPPIARARFRVSSTVMGLASEPFRNVLNSSSSRTITRSPQVWIVRDMDEENSLELVLICSPRLCTASTGMLAEKYNAIHVLLLILHNSTDGVLYKSLAKWHYALLCEVAFALDCVLPVTPWINLWLSTEAKSSPKEINDLRIASDPYVSERSYFRGILAFVMGDSNAFKSATEDWIWNYNPSGYGDVVSNEDFLNYSIVVVGLIRETLINRSEMAIQWLVKILNSIWSKVIIPNRDPNVIHSDYIAQNVISGIITGCVYRYLGRLTIEPETFMIKWKGTPKGLSVVLKTLSKTFNSALEHVPGGKMFLDSLYREREHPNIFVDALSGLELEDYRPGAKQILDISKLIG